MKMLLMTFSVLTLSSTLAHAAVPTFQCDFADNFFQYRDVISFTNASTVKYTAKIGQTLDSLSDICEGESLMVTSELGRANLLKIRGTVKCTDGNSADVELSFDKSKLILSGTWKGDVRCQSVE